MTRKWGSCSPGGRVSFATDLLGEHPEFQTVVIVHELLHLALPNHGRLFKSLMSAHVPGWRAASAETDRQLCATEQLARNETRSAF